MAYYKNQHYVPQAFLKQFCFKNKSLYQFDKIKNEIKPRNIENIAYKKYMYENDKSKTDLEKNYFRKIDNRGAIAIEQIVKEKSMVNLKKELKNVFITFFISQITRTLKNKHDIERFKETIEKNNISHLFDNQNIQSKFIDEMLVYDDLFLKEINNFYLEVVIIPNSVNLLISDNPVICKNIKNTREINKTKYFKTLSDIIYLPITPSLLFVATKKNDYLTEDKRDLIRLSNDLNIQQFDNAEQFVYGHSEYILNSTLNEYSSRNKKIILDSNPNLIDEHNKKDIIILSNPRLELSAKVRKELNKFELGDYIIEK